MKPLPRQTRSRLKRQALLEAALREFADNGYEATTSKTIATRAGVATGTFYQHFTSKTEILTAVASHRYETLYAQVIDFDMSDIPGIETADGVKERLLNVLGLAYDFHAEHPGFHAVVEQRRLADTELDAVVARGEETLLSRVREFATMFDGSDTEHLAFSIFAMIEGVIHRHVFHPNTLSKDKVLNILGACLGTYLVSLRAS